MKVNPDNKLEKLFERLRQEGWYCGWGLMCCSSCAWAEVPYEHEVGPFKGETVDFDKCLFNHEQDCQIDEQTDSTFCYSGDKQGVKNLKEILPIIEEMGCTYHWNGKGNSRIDIDWSDKGEQE
jgi:hypothetical protein